MYCANCGTANAAGAKFCAACGTPLAGPGGPSQESPVARSDVQENQYPVQLSIDYPETLSRLTTGFRLLLVIPVGFALSLISGGFAISVGYTEVLLGGGGFLVAGPLVMILFIREYPRWWFDFNRELLRFETRVLVYVFLRD